MNDIDFWCDSYMPIGTYYVPFQGVINGNGHWIRNLRLDLPYYGVGFVGYLGYNGVVKNINISVSCRFNARGTLGAVVGWNSGKITHCSSAADLRADDDFVGGIAGYNDAYGSIYDCEVRVGSNRSSGFGRKVGTFVGDNAGKSCSNCRVFWFYPW